VNQVKADSPLEVLRWLLPGTGGKARPQQSKDQELTETIGGSMRSSKPNPRMEEPRRRRISGVFPGLVDRRAFLDKVVVSVWGEKRESPDKLWVTRNRPIGGANRNYARSERGVLPDSENPYELRYGTMRLQSIIPPMYLTLRSERTQVTSSDAAKAIEFLCEEVSRATVSQVELTFDLSGVSVEWLRYRIFTRAKTFRRLRDENGRRTLYIGGRSSPWQVRIYDKMPDVVRLEFILRRLFLRKVGINSPPDLALLRDVNLASLIRIRRLNRSVLQQYAETLDERPGRLLSKWLRDLSLIDLSTLARYSEWTLPQGLFVFSRVDRQIRTMQDRLIV
jgi:hypothetical protein